MEPELEGRPPRKEIPDSPGAIRDESALPRGGARMLWGAGLILLGLFLGQGIPRGHHEAGATDRKGTVVDPVEEASPFIHVAEEVLPAVVSIESFRLFKHPAIPDDSTSSDANPFGPDGEIEMPSSGSGFLFDKAGYVLTNNHVVAGARSIRVHLADGRSFTGTVVGVDPPTDIAVVKVSGGTTPFPVVPLGDSDGVRIGEWVAAVGNPLGVLEGSLTVGVVSAKKRHEIEIAGSSPSYQDFIQTDAAINFGNSGGPLVNARGEAVGVNTAFGGPGRGLGFAVSINMARDVAKSLMADGHVVRGYLGVGLQALDANLAQGMNLRDTHGVLIRDVQPDTPAEKAGFHAGDVIVAFDGKPVGDLSDFRLMVAQAPVGRDVAIRYLRGPDENVLHVALAERPDFEHDAEPSSSPAPPAKDLGLELGLTTDTGELGDDGDSVGVVVKRVEPGSRAEDAGLSAGDVIELAGDRKITEPDQCLQLLDKAKAEGKVLVLKVQRGVEHWFVGVPPGDDEGGR